MDGTRCFIIETLSRINTNIFNNSQINVHLVIYITEYLITLRMIVRVIVLYRPTEACTDDNRRESP